MDAHWAASDAIFSLISQLSMFLLVAGFFLLYDRLNRDSKGGKRLVCFVSYHSLSAPAVLFIALVAAAVIALTESVTSSLLIAALLGFVLIAAFPVEVRENGIYALHRKWLLIKCDLVPWRRMRQYTRDNHRVVLTLYTGKKITFTIPPKIGPKFDQVMKRKMNNQPDEEISPEL